MSNKMYAVLTMGKLNAKEGDDIDTVTASRTGTDFATMDVALNGETYRLHVWPDKTWELQWCPLRWQAADNHDDTMPPWVFVAAGRGPRADKARLGRKVARVALKEIE